VHPVIDKLIPSALRSRATSFDKSLGTPYTDGYTFDNRSVKYKQKNLLEIAILIFTFYRTRNYSDAKTCYVLRQGIQ